MSDIGIGYRAMDGFSDNRRFKTLHGARQFAWRMVGQTPEIGNFYAVAGDGVGRVFMAGTTWKELFPACFPEERAPWRPMTEQEIYEAGCAADAAAEAEQDAHDMARSLAMRTPEEVAADAAYEASEAAHKAACLGPWQREPGGPYRYAGCTCCDRQLVQVGCDCGSECPF